MTEDEELTVSASEAELEANATLKGQAKFQAWEQARDKTVDDYYIGKRNGINIKLAMYLRRLKERRLDELADENGGVVTVDMELKVAKELQENEVYKMVSTTVHDDGDISSLYEDRKGLNASMTHQDAMTEIYYHDIKALEQLDALLTALIDEEDLPTRDLDGVDLAIQIGITGDKDGDERRNIKGVARKRGKTFKNLLRSKEVKEP